MKEQLTDFQKNKIFRGFNELVMKQKKAIDALDSCRINKSEMLVQMTLSEYEEHKDSVNVFYQHTTEQLDKKLFEFVNKYPEYEIEVLAYFNNQYSTLH